MISGFRRQADAICALLKYYTAYSSNLLPTFRDNLNFLTLEYGTYRLSRNVDKELPLHAA